MEAALDARLTAVAAQAQLRLRQFFHRLSQPDALRMLQICLLVILLVWAAASLSRALWGFVPIPAALEAATLINPISASQARASRARVNLDSLLEAKLFGAPGDAAVLESLAAAESAKMSESEAAVALAGIEDGAPESRLPLVLRGIASSSEAGLGQAVIEKGKRQDLFRVGDELPVNGNVVLAKVLPNKVVVDNSGRYELLTLFDESEPGFTQVVEQDARRVPVSVGAQSISTDVAAQRVSVGSGAAELAKKYRQQMYDDPQALADLVRVAPLRENGELTGYRVMPGKASQEFSRLGFESGDVVIAVNGVSLDDPIKIQRLYRDMRTATAASFEMLRNGETIVLDVSLADAGANTPR